MGKARDIIEPTVVIYITAQYGDPARASVLRCSLRMAKWREEQIPFMVDEEVKIITNWLKELRN